MKTNIPPEVSNEKYNAMDFLRDAVLIIDADYNVVYLNPACEQLLRIKKENVIYQSVFDIHPNAPEDVRHIENTVKYGKPVKVERMHYAFGEFDNYFNLETHVLEENGEVIGALAEFSDVTDFVKREEKFKHSLEQMASNIILLPEDKGILPLNQTIINELEIETITEQVLISVSESKLSALIVDLSSVFEANQHFFHSISALLNALELLGVEVSISGVKPCVAQKMVTSGITLEKSKVRIIRSLKNAF